MEPNAKNLRVIPFQPTEKLKMELRFENSTDDLINVMSELLLVEKMTGRTGLPQRVCMAFNYILQDAMRIAEARHG